MYLLVGANGFLGSYILKNILKKTTDNIVAIARNIPALDSNDRVEWLKCDISEREDVDKICEQMLRHREIKVIFLAAYHNPDLVEKNIRFAWNINVTSLSYFINKLENVKCLFYPSSDSVYGNSTNRYHFKETDRLEPVNTYGRQKVAAESIINCYGYNVVRFPFLISPSLTPAKKHFYDVIESTIKGNKEIEMLADSYRSTLSFHTAAALLIDVIEGYGETAPKILNICGDDDLSKYDVGVKIAEKLRLNKNLIVPITINENNDFFEVKRAQTTLMDNSKLKSLLKIKKIKFEI